MATGSLTFPQDRTAVLIYDGLCPLCQRSVAVLKRLDWFGRLTYADARNPDTWPESPVPIDQERSLEEMHLVTPDRQSVYAGFFAFRWLAGRLPLLWVAWPALYLPGIPAIGTRVYRYIAKNRFGLVPCTDGACAVPQQTSASSGSGAKARTNSAA